MAAFVGFGAAEHVPYRSGASSVCIRVRCHGDRSQQSLRFSMGAYISLPKASAISLEKLVPHGSTCMAIDPSTLRSTAVPGTLNKCCSFKLTEYVRSDAGNWRLWSAERPFLATRARISNVTTSCRRDARGDDATLLRPIQDCLWTRTESFYSSVD